MPITTAAVVMYHATMPDTPILQKTKALSKLLWRKVYSQTTSRQATATLCLRDMQELGQSCCRVCSHSMQPQQCSHTRLQQLGT